MDGKEKYTVNSTNSGHKDDSVKDVVEDFVNRSTLHGLQNVYNSRSKIHKIIWILLMLGASIYVFIMISQSFARFLSYPVKTKTTLVMEKQSVFPAVTLCNFNRYRKSPLRGTMYEQPLLNAISPRYAQSDQFSWEKFNFTGFHMLENEKRSAHQLKTMLFVCSWKGRSCSHDNFTEIFTSMGKCYTFNSGASGISTPLLLAEGAGESHGLKVTLSSEQDEYFGLPETAGFKILLHDQDEPPLVENFGTSAPPGFRTTMAVQKTRVVNQPKPYEKGCDKDIKLENYPVYTKHACYLQCMEDKVIGKCGCRPVEYRTPVKYCNPKELFDCVLPAQVAFSSVIGEVCSCPEACDTISYEASTSYNLYPSQVLLDFYFKEFKELGLNYTTEQVDKLFRTNMVNVNVFYQQLTYLKGETVPAYGSLDLFSDLGGQIGLFLGCSMLTLMEFVELLLNLVIWRVGRKKRISDVHQNECLN